jgi:hypothetical protein
MVQTEARNSAPPRYYAGSGQGSTAHVIRASKKPGQVPPLPMFRSRGTLVDIADRDVLYGRAVMLVVDTHALVCSAD